MATLYKEYTVTPAQFVSETFDFPGAYRQGGQPAPPAWFEFIDGAEILGIQTYNGYQFTAPGIGTYDILFTSFDLAPFYVRINVVLGTVEEYANCCGDRNIAWLNIQGGWQNYIFSGIKTFQVEAGEDKQFKTSDYVLKHSEVNGVYDGEIISTGDIPQSHVDALDGLRAKSVQAFLYSDETEAWDIPILIDRSSYTKYRSRDKFFEVRIKFIYAEEILVQTQ